MPPAPISLSPTRHLRCSRSCTQGWRMGHSWIEARVACPLQCSLQGSQLSRASHTLTRLTASWACIILMFLDGFRSESSCVEPR